MNIPFSSSLRKPHSLGLCAVLTLLVVSSISLHAQPAPLREGQKLDAVVAVVGKHPILKSSLDGQVELFLVQSGKKTELSKEELTKLRADILQSEIDQKVLLVRAEQDSITVSEDEVDDRIDEQVKTFERQAGSRQALEKQLGKTVAEIKASPDYRDRARETILVEKLRYQKFPPSPVISRHDVETFYTLFKDSLPEISAQAELATIIKYIRPDPNQKEKVKVLAKKVLDSLRNGGDFTVFAARYGSDGTAQSGGDLGGPHPRGTFVPDFESAAFRLKPGELSDVVETEFGFHIIKLTDRKGEEIRVSHILFKPTASTTEEDSVKVVMQDIRQKALKGEDFGKLAAQNSDDGESKNDGGKIGRVRLEEMTSNLRSAVDSMQVGNISEPFKVSLSRTLTGFQIVKLLSRVSPHKPTLESDYRDIETTAKQWKAMKDMQTFVASSRSRVYIQIKDPSHIY